LTEQSLDSPQTKMMPKIVSVHSFRRGTGKSSLIANLAVTIAQQGQRVGILDADLPQPSEPEKSSVRDFLGLAAASTTQTLTDVMLGTATLKDVACDLASVVSSPERLFLIPYQIGPSKGLEVLQELHDIGLLSVTIEQILSEFALDCLLIDIQAGINEQTLPLLALSDVLLLMLSLERPDFQGVAVAVDVAKRLEIPQTLLALAQVPPSIDLERFQQEAEAIYGIGMAGSLPWVENLADDRGVFCQRYPDDDFAQSTAAIAQRTFFQTAGVQLVPPTPLHRPTRGTQPGLSLLDLLELPDPQRQLLNWMMRRRTVALDDILKKFEDEAAVQSLLEDLLERGFVVEVEINAERCYQPAIAPKQSRKVDRRLWEVLEGDTDE